MLEQYGLQELAQQYGLLYALIPVLILGIISGLIASFGNEKLYWPSPERSKDTFKKKVRTFAFTFIGLFFLTTWYLFSFQFYWWFVIILLLISIVIYEPFVGRDSLVSINHKKEIRFDVMGSFILMLAFLVFATMIHALQDMTGLHEATLDDQEKKTYYIQNNNLEAFNVVESKTDIDPLHRLGIYIHNIDDESIQAEAILLSRDLQIKFQGADHDLAQLLFGVESFIRQKYKRSDSIFRNIGYSKLADISKVLDTAPLIFKTGIQSRYTLQRDLIPQAINKFVEEFESIVSDKLPELPKEEYVSNFKWEYWYNLMQAIILFSVTNFIFLIVGAFLIRKTLKPEYKN